MQRFDISEVQSLEEYEMMADLVHGIVFFMQYPMVFFLSGIWTVGQLFSGVLTAPGYFGTLRLAHGWKGEEMFPISTERETSLEKSCVMRTLVGFGVFFILSWFVDFVYIPLIFFLPVLLSS